MRFDLLPLVLTFKLALLTCPLLFLASLPVVYFLYFTRSPLAPLLRALVNMPLVLPPVVIGFYLLLLFNPASAAGAMLFRLFHIRLVFTFEGLVVASILFNIPFMVNPLLAGLEGLPRTLAEASFASGKGRAVTFCRVLLPSIRPGILTGMVLTAAHTAGEFGVALMIGGKIGGVTKVASIAIYDKVESLDFTSAHQYSAVLVAASFAVLAALFFVNNRSLRPW